MSVPCETYQRCLEPGFTPFDPLELAKQTEDIVCRGDRLRWRFLRENSLIPPE